MNEESYELARQALGFYASSASWKDPVSADRPYVPKVWVDRGARAREALEAFGRPGPALHLAEKIEQLRSRIDRLEEEKGALLNALGEGKSKLFDTVLHLAEENEKLRGRIDQALAGRELERVVRRLLGKPINLKQDDRIELVDAVNAVSRAWGSVVGEEVTDEAE